MCTELICVMSVLLHCNKRWKISSNTYLRYIDRYWKLIRRENDALWNRTFCYKKYILNWYVLYLSSYIVINVGKFPQSLEKTWSDMDVVLEKGVKLQKRDNMWEFVHVRTSLKRERKRRIIYRLRWKRWNFCKIWIEKMVGLIIIDET